uniref:Ig-like domain-containing protein n=1 Tax=Calidris pygmaea TaxID=425635 RepID=A0A8C3KJ77_9CHAR
MVTGHSWGVPTFKAPAAKPILSPCSWLPTISQLLWGCRDTAVPLPYNAHKLTWVQPPSLCVLLCHPADFRVVGPNLPLLATVGQDVVLPCHLSPNMDARSLEIRWIRQQLSETVHLYRNGEDQYDEQMKEYAGRTELARGGLSSGSLDLRISELRPSDDGQYVCTVQDAATYGEATVELEVAAPFFHNARPWMAALGVLLLLLLMCFGVIAYLFRRKGEFVVGGMEWRGSGVE